MITPAVLCIGLLGAAPPEGPPAPDPAAYEAAYREERARAGRDADAHVRLALWCEERGLDAERLKHLAIAVLRNPGHATARGLMGLVADAGTWRRPEAVAERLQADAKAAAIQDEYRARRDRTPAKADAQWKLALWCESKGLAAEAKAHATIVTRLDPDHAAARKRLGFRKQGSRWITSEQLAEEKAEAERQKKADREWRPRLEKLREQLSARDEAKRKEAERELAAVTHPYAVPSVMAVFGAGPADRQMVAVQILGQIDAAMASRSLAGLAVFSPAAKVREAAIQTLVRRDPRDFVRPLLGLIRDPIKYRALPVGQPGENGELFVEGEKYDVHRTYGIPALHPWATLPRLMDLSVPFDPFGPTNILMANGVMRDPAPAIPHQAAQGAAHDPKNAASILADAAANASPDPAFVSAYRAGMAAAARREMVLGMMRVDIQRTNEVARARQEEDVRNLENTNAEYHRLNRLVLPILEATTGQDFGEDRGAWERWWTDQEGYAVPSQTRTYEKPVITEFIEVPFVIRPSTSCFGAGTAVRTREGSTPIESIKVGDQVLTQDSRTGALRFEPVLSVHHNPPAQTLRVSLGEETVVATGIHRFWKAGHGWAMARDLKVGDRIRTLGGVARVTAVVEDETQPVFNLEVAGGSSFFVGTRGALVHDNSLVQPTPEPFDAAPGPKAVAANTPAR